MAKILKSILEDNGWQQIGLYGNGWEEKLSNSLMYKNLVAECRHNYINIYTRKSWYTNNGDIIFTITNEDQLNKFLEFLKIM